MKKNNKDLQNVYLEFQDLRQQIEQLQMQVHSVNSSILELKNLENSLEEIKNLKKDDEILIPLGNNIFIPGKLGDNKEVIVGVGSNILTRKNVPDTKDMVISQMKELEKVNAQLEQEIINSSLYLEKLQDEIIRNKEN